MALSLYSSGSTDALLAVKLSDAPIDGSTYGRLNGAWAVVSGGGGLTINDLSNGATSTLNATVPTTGQALTYDGTDLKWATFIPGDRYLSTSTTSNTIGNGNKTFTIGTGLSYTPTQDLTISYNAANHMHGEVLTYNSSTGVLTVDIKNHTGSGTYTSWVVNVGGVTPATSVAFSDITGAVSGNTNLQAALDLKANLASPTFTGTVTIPSGASISGYLTTASAALSYYPLSGNPSGFLTSAPVTSVAGRTGAITLAVADVSGAAPTASPSLSGTPLSTTATADTNTTQIATTAYVVGQASATTPAATGTAAIGTSLKYARADHVHANPLPTGGTTGQVLSKVDGTNYNVQWSTAGGGGVDIQTFGSSTTSGTFTWTKPANAKWVEFYLVGGGGGGGSGGRYATTSGRSGGGGGGGAPAFYGLISAGYLGSTETVVIGAGGAGGASRTTDTTAGASGSDGTSTTFSLYSSGYGASGLGGSTTAGTNGTSRQSVLINTTSLVGAGGAGTLTTGTTASSNSFVNLIPVGGGGGGGASAASTTNASGGIGAGFSNSPTNASIISTVAGGSRGTSSGIAATAGTSATTQYMMAGTGGGGGYYITATAGGAGGAGGWPGGAGGGGGASDNGFASGAGGAGANGFAVIITYF